MLPKFPSELKIKGETLLCPICYKPLELIYINGNHYFYRCRIRHKTSLPSNSTERYEFHPPQKSIRNLIYMVKKP